MLQQYIYVLLPSALQMFLRSLPKPAYYSRNCYKGAYYASIILTKKMCLLCSNYASIIYQPL